VIDAKPTTYQGVAFRSILEARWAVMFDLLGWIWDFEPAIPLSAYIPDFLVRAPLRRPAFARAPATALVLMEAKPIVSTLDYEAPVRKIALSGWEHAAVVLGPVLWPVGELWAFGFATDRVERRDALPGGHEAWFPVGVNADNELELGGGRDVRDLWRRAGNKTQWLPRTP
jgi:hypothetical protein